MLSGGEYSVGILVMFWGGGTIMVIMIIYGILKFINVTLEASIKADKIMEENLLRNPDHYGNRQLIGLKEVKQKIEDGKWESQELIGEQAPWYLPMEDMEDMEEKKVSDELTVFDAIKHWWEKPAKPDTYQEDFDNEMRQLRWGGGDDVELLLNSDTGEKNLQIAEEPILQLQKDLKYHIGSVSFIINLLYLPSIQKSFLAMSFFTFSFKTKTNKNFSRKTRNSK